MLLSFNVHENAAFLHCETAGKATLQDMLASVDFIKSLAAGRRHRRVLMDMRAVEHDLPFTEHLQLGSYLVDHLSDIERLASVVRPGRLVGVAAKVAQKLGVEVRTFDDQAEAERWLTS
ncbi:STAS/SEC14 domain-containing protein [Ramlibacter algicola]|uniref:STAS/SEC14 domain-containing protein n=1 Tax=Ramlibacter algicola TaxID=2795217 RepID=A0A934Q2S4_9BURK|nr:STAS/SEC14 domain-containing protein [Ramlibacter algicola]MBK0393753.1 STAS/SEC14 domain-containing protein [Ramlibacter algicola]